MSLRVVSFTLAIMAGTCQLTFAQVDQSITAKQETELIHRYCGGCHSDRLMYGGLSVANFDAAMPPPSLAAMLLSKITRGHTPRDIAAADSSAVLAMMKASAMGAAGMGVPEDRIQVALAQALARQAAGAYEWHTVYETTAEGPLLVASVIREKPSVKRPGATDSYRLILSCDVRTSKGELKISWADYAPSEGQMMTVALDGVPSFDHKIVGGRAQGNGDYGPGATTLPIPLPAKKLTISSLFSDGNIEFSFADLGEGVRREFAACFRPSPGTGQTDLP